ncbi:radical SAM protein [Blastococcus sp. CT_GayMR20]|uniref:radical SAM protein n=1 Tax=Blastococcus sp. CT_GayMR20 TaxID=2559609 RepID=UPI0010732352|nr:radical SAM protein [Blastococcus sp. CT_GayMR20]TFV66832.1 radical SAM protein [Blastococcus sp. CT_GayMR20]
MTTTLTAAEGLKFDLLAEGLAISSQAAELLAAVNHGRPLTPADYASTSGVILQLPDDTWVNAPIAAHNANFVLTPRHELGVEGDRLVVRTGDRATPVRFWLPPAWHGEANGDGEPYNSYAFMHADRVRISPIEGCAFTCRFCDLPYEFRYRNKRLDGLLDVVDVALNDPVQPAYHVLISGGTPRPEDYDYVRSVYREVISGFPGVPVDIMMVPIADVMDPVWLAELGVAEISVNLEVWGLEAARALMPRKHKQGREYYLDYLARAAGVLGGSRVRSMLMLGLEPLEDTLAGVEAIAELGCTPVLSPFRPDPSTPLRDHPVPTAEFMLEAYSRALEITRRHGVALGPACRPCAHNTLSLSTVTGNGDASMSHGAPRTV